MAITSASGPDAAPRKQTLSSNYVLFAPLHCDYLYVTNCNTLNK